MAELMVNWVKKIVEINGGCVLIIVALLFASASCDNKSHPENSIIGTWRCYEEHRSVTPYNISIDYASDDTTSIIIRNLHNTGFDVETYATLADTVITFYLTESTQGHDFSGTGHVSRDYSGIYWEYSYFGPGGSMPFVEVWSVRP